MLEAINWNQQKSMPLSCVNRENIVQRSKALMDPMSQMVPVD